MTFDPEAQRIITEYREMCRRTAHEIFNEDVFDTRANSLSRLPEFAMKKAALHAVARAPRVGEAVVVNADDACFGVDEAGKAYEAFLKIRELQETQMPYPKSKPKEVTRRRIRESFTKEEMTSKEIHEATGIGLSTVQRHLREMKREGLLKKIGITKSAKWRIIY